MQAKISEYCKSNQKILIAIAGLGAVVMAVTNPGKNAYVEYAVARFENTLPNQICQSPQFPAFSEFFKQAGVVIGPLCKFATRGGIFAQRPILESLLKTTTYHRNWVLFSFYETELPVRTFRTVGLLGNFITFP